MPPPPTLPMSGVLPHFRILVINSALFHSAAAARKKPLTTLAVPMMPFSTLATKSRSVASQPTSEGLCLMSSSVKEPSNCPSWQGHCT